MDDPTVHYQRYFGCLVVISEQRENHRSPETKVPLGLILLKHDDRIIAHLFAPQACNPPNCSCQPRIRTAANKPLPITLHKPIFLPHERVPPLTLI